MVKDHLVRAKLSNVEIIGRLESCGKGNCQVCDFICDTDTFTSKPCGETFKIQSGILNWNFQMVVYLLKCRLCGEVKTKFRARFNNCKSARRSYWKKRKVSQQRFHERYGQHSHNEIDEQCKTCEQLKEKKTFWQYRLKMFYPYGLNEKKEYLYWVIFLTFLLLVVQFFNHFNFYFCFNFYLFHFLFFCFFFSIQQLTNFWIYFCASNFPNSNI